jgi:hypothetical protein
MSFTEQLQRQSEFLRRSCRDYDNGHVEEALRIAVALRILFHDTKTSTSLLTHLKTKQVARILTTFEPGFTKNKQTGLMAITIPMFVDHTGARHPPLDSSDRHEFVSVTEWWDQVVMGSNQRPSRKDIILSAANQDGGAHVDAEPGAKAKELISGVGTFAIERDGVVIEKRTLSNHHFPLIRQFGYEVLNSPDIWTPLLEGNASDSK